VSGVSGADAPSAEAYRLAVEEIARLERGRETERTMLRGAMVRIKELENQLEEARNAASLPKAGEGK